jgi:hypothetical protein
MSLSHRPHSHTPSPGATLNVTPSTQFTPEEMAAIVEAERQHVDDTLHPLKVQGLEHYIDSPVVSERFHIS